MDTSWEWRKGNSPNNKPPSPNGMGDFGRFSTGCYTFMVREEESSRYLNKFVWLENGSCSDCFFVGKGIVFKIIDCPLLCEINN